MKELLEAGVHFGHQTRRWNPKMKPFIFGKRNGIHIVDLQKTLHHFEDAADFIRDLAANGRNVLFVGTKRQAQDAIREEAERCGMFFMNHRWLGGTMTNFRTIRKSIQRFKDIEKTLSNEESHLTKKELIRLERQRRKMDRAFGGIKDMEDLPDALFVIDTVHEHIAIKEANHTGGGGCRHKLGPRRGRLPDSRQRRCDPRYSPLHLTHRRQYPRGSQPRGRALRGRAGGGRVGR
jgi:small subunit ribosomal protein S2